MLACFGGLCAALQKTLCACGILCVANVCACSRSDSSVRSLTPRFAAGRRGVIEISSIDSLTPIATALFGHVAPVRSLYINNVGTVLVTGCDDSLVRFWNL